MMTGIENDILRLLLNNPGLTDRELADSIKGHGRSPQYINQICRALVSRHILVRKKRSDGLIGNWLLANHMESETLDLSKSLENAEEISEKKIKRFLESYLISLDWKPRISWGSGHGIDIEARRGAEKWIIEVKGSGDYNPKRVKDFLSVLGEILQRMDDPDCKYSIGLPDLETYRRLWDRLPVLARSRTGISVLFVNSRGQVTERNSHP